MGSILMIFGVDFDPQKFGLRQYSILEVVRERVEGVGGGVLRYLGR